MSKCSTVGLYFMFRGHQNHGEGWTGDVGRLRNMSSTYKIYLKNTKKIYFAKFVGGKIK
jgi:hypothetical protein